MNDDFAATVRRILEKAEREFRLDKAVPTDFGNTFNEMAERFRTTSARVDEELERGARVTKHRTRL
jgi:hypothetical protein